MIVAFSPHGFDSKPTHIFCWSRGLPSSSKHGKMQRYIQEAKRMSLQPSYGHCLPVQTTMIETQSEWCWGHFAVWQLKSTAGLTGSQFCSGFPNESQPLAFGHPALSLGTQMIRLPREAEFWLPGRASLEDEYSSHGSVQVLRPKHVFHDSLAQHCQPDLPSTRMCWLMSRADGGFLWVSPS